MSWGESEGGGGGVQTLKLPFVKALCPHVTKSYYGL